MSLLKKYVIIKKAEITQAMIDEVSPDYSVVVPSAIILADMVTESPYWCMAVYKEYPDTLQTYRKLTLAEAQVEMAKVQLEIAPDNRTVDRDQELTPYQTQEFDDAGGGVEYFGSTKTDGTWMVRRITTSGQDFTIEYANYSNNTAQTTFTLAWTNRVTLTYDLLENLTGV